MSLNPVPHVLVPLPDRDFDPIETAVSWSVCVHC